MKVEKIKNLRLFFFSFPVICQAKTKQSEAKLNPKRTTVSNIKTAMCMENTYLFLCMSVCFSISVWFCSNVACSSQNTTD